MKKYLPKDKSDEDFEEYLKMCDFEQIKEDIPELLTWLQDMNWQVGQKIAKQIREKFINNIVDDLIVILKGKDEEWKYSILALLFLQNNKKINPRLVKEITRLSESPTQFEIASEVNDIAKDVLDYWESESHE